MDEVVGIVSLLMRHVFDYVFTHGRRVATRLHLSWTMNVPHYEMLLGAFCSITCSMFMFPCSNVLLSGKIWKKPLSCLESQILRLLHNTLVCCQKLQNLYVGLQKTVS